MRLSISDKWLLINEAEERLINNNVRNSLQTVKYNRGLIELTFIQRNSFSFFENRILSNENIILEKFGYNNQFWFSWLMHFHFFSNVGIISIEWVGKGRIISNIFWTAFANGISTNSWRTNFKGKHKWLVTFK